MRTLFTVLALATLLAGCTLERNNPLDPKNSGVEAPKEVINIQISASGAGSTVKWVEVSWTGRAEDAGYYIYRGMSYTGRFQRLEENGIPTSASIVYPDNSVFSGNTYYYKVSAFNDSGLEGPISSPVIITVQ